MSDMIECDCGRMRERDQLRPIDAASEEQVGLVADIVDRHVWPPHISKPQRGWAKTVAREILAALAAAPEAKDAPLWYRPDTRQHARSWAQPGPDWVDVHAAITPAPEAKPEQADDEAALIAAQSFIASHRPADLWTPSERVAFVDGWIHALRPKPSRRGEQQERGEAR